MTIATDMARDVSTYPPAPVFPNIPQEQLNNWLEALRIEPVSAIDWIWPIPWTVGPRIIGDSMWFILLSGSAEAWVEDPHQIQSLRPGTMMLIPANVKHMIRATGESKPNLIAVHFYSTLFGGINVLEMLGFPHFIQDSTRLHLREASRRMADEFAVKAPGWKQSMGAEIFQLLLRTIRNLPETFKPANDHHGHPDLPRIFPAVEWIDKNLGRSEIDVEEIASTVFLSPTHFRRIFHEVFGMSPISFVRKRRVERAAILIRTSDMSLKEIAYTCGFTDTTYFSKTFRKLMHKTPNGYRLESVV
ncbi:MAG TPA: AraC family transcriptional regulator [Acidobacteriaceae bacterium]